MTEELVIPDIGKHSHSMFKPCCMTIFIHDYAVPQSDRIKMSPLVTISGKRKEPIPLQIYSNWTLELVRGLTDQQLGKLVRETLNKIDEEKSKIENKGR
jgi:hypothetical protein